MMLAEVVTEPVPAIAIANKPDALLAASEGSVEVRVQASRCHTSPHNCVCTESTKKETIVEYS